MPFYVMLYVISYIRVLNDVKMMKQYLIILIACMLSLHTVAQQYGAFKDHRDGKVYKTVKIGSQVWMAEDLRTPFFLNGENFSSGDFYDNSDSATPSFCIDDSSFFYNGYAAIDRRGLCPEGWHIPTMSDWNKLIELLGGYSIAGKKMKSKSAWKPIITGGESIIICPNCKDWTDEYKSKVPCHRCKDRRTIKISAPIVKRLTNGTNQSGFNVLPLNYPRCSIGDVLRQVYKPYDYALFWSSDEPTDYRKTLFTAIKIDGSSRITSESIRIKDGASCRCIKN